MVHAGKVADRARTREPSTLALLTVPRDEVGKEPVRGDPLFTSATGSMAQWTRLVRVVPFLLFRGFINGSPWAINSGWTSTIEVRKAGPHKEEDP